MTLTLKQTREQAQIEHGVCQRCGWDDKPLAIVDGLALCPHCGRKCPNCGELGRLPVTRTWYEHETGPQSEDGCLGCLPELES